MYLTQQSITLNLEKEEEKEEAEAEARPSRSLQSSAAVARVEQS